MKFLHMADVHLGCRRYNVDERTRDFFRAWYDIIENYAVRTCVDFVLISGDFFDRRNVDPQAMNHAIVGLTRLRDKGIPVIAVEGNHDQKEVSSEFSWMRSLSSWGFLKLLEPEYDEDNRIRLSAWDEESKTGSYIDIAQARIFGSHWYGASAHAAIPLLSAALETAATTDKFNILMLHTDVEGQSGRPIPALPIAALKELRTQTNYLALGHTHKRFEIENWAFNPGALEPTSIDEYREERGVYLVEVDDEFNISAVHINNYVQRPFQRLDFDVSGLELPEQVLERALEKFELEARRFDPIGSELAPIVEVTLIGRLGFGNSLLPLNKLRAAVKDMTGALQVLVRNQSVPLTFGVAESVSLAAPRHEREQRIIEDLVARNNLYAKAAPEVAALVIEAKRLALLKESPNQIADLIDTHIFPESHIDLLNRQGEGFSNVPGFAALERSAEVNRLD